MKRQIIIFKNVILIFIFISICNASMACCIVTFSDGSKYEMEGDCSTVCYGNNGYPKCQPSTRNILDPKKYYILVNVNGEAWAVKGDQKTPIASDGLMQLQKKLIKAYGNNTKDKETLKKIDKEYDEYKKIDNHKVSKERIELFSKESGLKIVRQ